MSKGDVMQAIVMHLGDNGPARVRDLITQFGVNAKNILRELIEQGVLVKQRDGIAMYYLLPGGEIPDQPKTHVIFQYTKPAAFIPIGEQPRRRFKDRLADLERPEFWQEFLRHVEHCQQGTTFGQFLAYYSETNASARLYARKNEISPMGIYGSYSVAFRRKDFIDILDTEVRSIAEKSPTRAITALFFTKAPASVKAALRRKFQKDFAAFSISEEENEGSAQTHSWREAILEVYSDQNTRIHRAADRYLTILSDQAKREQANYPAIMGKARKGLHELSEKVAPHLSTDGIRDLRGYHLNAGKNKIVSLQLIGKTLFQLDPRLVIAEYLLPMYPSAKIEASEIYITRFSWFDGRFEQVLKAMKLSPESPKSAIIALAFAAHSGFEVGTMHAQRLVQRTEQVTGFASIKKGLEYPKVMSRSIAATQRAQAYVSLCMDTMNMLTQKAGLSEKEVMLLTDVALIHAQGKNTIVNESFKDLALDTISKLVSKNHWEEAYVCRDFLLTHFPATFPAWRTNHTTRHASSRTTFAQLHDAVQKRELELSENDIPKDLKRHFLRSTQ